MEFWEFVLEQDFEVDLATAEYAALKRCGCLPEQVTSTEPGFDSPPDRPWFVPWKGFHQNRWRNLVWTFRSVVRRLHRRQTRLPGRMRPAWADRVFRMGVACIVPIIMPTNLAPPRWNWPREPWWPGRARGSREDQHVPGMALSHKNYGGVTLEPPELPHRMPISWHIAVDRSLAREAKRWPRFDLDHNRWAVFAIDKFWIRVFGSLIGAGVPPVCPECRQPLGLTPKGRRPRAGMCKRCADAKRYKTLKQDPETLRKKWAEDKKRQRAALKKKLTGKRREN